MASLVLARLTNRKLLRIVGPDCYPYLQGLLSNDIRYLYEPDRLPEKKYARRSSNVISTFMLNAQGRAICDMLLYRTPSTRSECKFTPPGESIEPDELLIECDSSLASGLANTLYGYRVRRKVNLSIEDKLNVWCLFAKINATNSLGIIPDQDSKILEIIPDKTDEILTDDLIVVSDPRLSSMGMRIISETTDFDVLKKSIQSVINTEITSASLKDYKLFRYQLGVSEGAEDHPESNCFPLECNGDFLNSISYTKGCYLGQELTARTHYTGVVRKRIMPIVLDLNSKDNDSANAPLISGTEIIDANTNRKVGFLRNVVKNRALALLRHEKAIGSQHLIHEGTKTKIVTYMPYWWSLS